MLVFVFFFKQKTAYEMRISDWSSDVCSSDLLLERLAGVDEHVVACFHASLVERARHDDAAVAAIAAAHGGHRVQGVVAEAVDGLFAGRRRVEPAVAPQAVRPAVAA